MLDSQLRTWAEIDYDAIPHNLEEIRRLTGKTRIMGIVKANAYGHGAVECSRVMAENGVDFFAVACLDEAVELRKAGIDQDILILGYTAEEGFPDLLRYDLIQTVVSLEYARKLSAYGSRHGRIRTHVKVDTGMNRTGILFESQEQKPRELLEVYTLPGIQPEGIFSHYPVSDDLSQESRCFTMQQTELFSGAVQYLKEHDIDPGILHIQNSYGILNYGDMGMDYCRPGLLYMGVTSDDSIPIASQPDFIPILSLKTRVSMVKTIQPGATVSYGRHYTAKKPTRIASLTIGYADGLPRACSNQGLEVLIHGRRAPIVGNICMDQCMIDVTDIPDVREGDIVTVVGRDGDEVVTIDQISRLAGSINNETLTRISSRVPRISASDIHRK